MFFYLFLIYTSTLVTGQEQNFSNQPHKVNLTHFDNTTNVRHRFSTNSSSDIYSNVLKQRRAQREGNSALGDPNTNGSPTQEPKLSNHILDDRREYTPPVQDFSKNRLLAERANYVEVLPSKSIDYNFTSLGSNGTNYLTAFGLRDEKKKKNVTLLEFDRDTFISDLKNPLSNDLIQNVTKKQVSANNGYDQRAPRNQGFDPRNPSTNEVDPSRSQGNFVQNSQGNAPAQNQNFGQGQVSNGQFQNQFRQNQNQGSQNGNPNGPQNDRENRNFGNNGGGFGNQQNQAQNSGGNQGNFQSGNSANNNNPTSNPGGQNGPLNQGTATQNGTSFNGGGSSQNSTVPLDSEPQGTFHNTNQVPQNNFQSFQDDRSGFGRAVQPSSVYGSDTPFRQTPGPVFPQPNQPSSGYGAPGNGGFSPSQGNQGGNFPSVPSNEYGPGPAQTTFSPPIRPFTPSPVGPSNSYGSPNIPQGGGPQNTPDGGYPSFQPQGGGGVPPSNQYGGPISGPSPQAPAPSQGYPSGRPQGPSLNQGYPSGGPPAPSPAQGYPSGPTPSQGYPSGRPQVPSNQGYPSGGPQAPSNQGYPSGRPQAPAPTPPTVAVTQRPQPVTQRPEPSGYSARTVPNIPFPPRNGGPQRGGQKVHKHIYFHVAPPFEEDRIKTIPKGDIDAPAPEKHYKILFIKTPTAAPQTSIIAQNQKDEKTLVYVLVKKPEDGDVNIVTPKPTPPSKPEVYFIRYKNKRDEGNATDQDPKGYPKEKPEGEYSYPKPTSGTPVGTTSGGDYQYPRPTIGTILERKDIQPTQIPIVSPLPLPVSPVYPLVQPDTIQIQPQVQLPNYETYLTLNDHYQKSYGEGVEAVHQDPGTGIIYHQGTGDSEAYGANTANLLLGQYENIVYV